MYTVKCILNSCLPARCVACIAALPPTCPTPNVLPICNWHKLALPLILFQTMNGPQEWL